MTRELIVKNFRKLEKEKTYNGKVGGGIRDDLESKVTSRCHQKLC